MTSTRSAADTGLPSNRRSFVTSLGAAALLSASALASSIPPADDPHPDAELFKLEKRLTAADNRRKALSQRCDKIMASTEEAPIPANLFCLSSDGIFVDPAGSLDLAKGPNGKPSYTYATNGVVEALRSKIAEWDALPARTRILCGIERKAARAKEIIAGVERWEAERRAAEAAAGFTAAEKACDIQVGVFADLQQRIAATPANTAEGVLVKARAALMAGCASSAYEEGQFSKPDRSPHEIEKLLILSVMVDAAKVGAQSTTAS